MNSMNISASIQKKWTGVSIKYYTFVDILQKCNLQYSIFKFAQLYNYCCVITHLAEDTEAAIWNTSRWAVRNIQENSFLWWCHSIWRIENKKKTNLVNCLFGVFWHIDDKARTILDWRDCTQRQRETNPWLKMDEGREEN